MRNFTQRTSVRILTQVILVSLFVIQNHCGLLAASSLIHNAVISSSMSSSQTSMPCHQAKSSSKESKECNQDCCTKLQAVFQTQEIKVTLGELSSQDVQPMELSRTLHRFDSLQKPANETPPHLSFQRSFYTEAFPSHAPPETLLA